MSRNYTEDLFWDQEKEIGFYPVKDTWYDDLYYEASVEKSRSKIADELNKFRVNLVNKYTMGRILDFGTGCGQFIEYRGNCLGYDICYRAVVELRKKNLYYDFWNDDFGRRKIEAVTMFDVLEHVGNPTTVLSQISCRYVFISIPIFRSKDHVLKSKHFKPREHYWYFSQKSIRALMKNNGFTLIECRNDEIKMGREDIYTYVFRNDGEQNKDICDLCFCRRNDFYPAIGNRYMCLKEYCLFRYMISLNGKKPLCLLNDSHFRRIEIESSYT